jgi:CheY-like chemotaxis protein
MIAHVLPEAAFELALQGDVTRTILIVDHDQEQASRLSRRLSDQGYVTVNVQRGLLALGIAQADPPDLILLDPHLPDMNGLEVCRDLSDSPLTCHIPIILLAGLEHPVPVRQARAAGCTFFLHKPYDPNVLLTLIDASLSSVR